MDKESYYNFIFFYDYNLEKIENGLKNTRNQSIVNFPKDFHRNNIASSL